MSNVIVATGSWGDIQPNAVLGDTLQKAGYVVLQLPTEEFRFNNVCLALGAEQGNNIAL